MRAVEGGQVPDDAGEYADALAAVLDRVPLEDGRRIGCRRGWYPILAALHAALSDVAPGHIVHRADERMGVLRYAIDWRLLGPIRDHVQGLIDAAVAQSARTCEWCGSPGVLRARPGWVKTLCDADAARLGGFVPVPVTGPVDDAERP